MSKYIDVEPFENALMAVQKKSDVISIAEVLNTLMKYPAADVVEVVRCKECRYREKEHPGMVYCPYTVGGWVDEDWFCAGGKKE